MKLYLIVNVFKYAIGSNGGNIGGWHNRRKPKAIYITHIQWIWGT